jgi:hypothetical protein
MSDRIISISAAPYDGYAFPATLDSIASCGAQYVEPAFIVGYTEPFDESSFRLSKVPQLHKLVKTKRYPMLRPLSALGSW